MKENRIYKAAFSQIDITPEFQTSLVGRYRPENSQGILHRLYAQALLFQNDDERFCLIAIDNLGLDVPLAEVIRSKIAIILNTDVSRVMLNFSHTHSAPDPTPLAFNGERYFDFLCKQIISCVETAIEDFRTCKIGWALTTTSIGENRRDGCTVTDNRLGALMVADRDSGKPIVLIARIAAHNNILPAVNLNVSSDFIGVARKELQDFYGFPIMFLQGAAGNIKATGTNMVGEGSDDDLLKVVGILVDSVKSLRFELHDINDIQMFSRKMTCVSDVPSKEEAEKIAADYMNSDAQDWLQACNKLIERGISSQSFQMEVNFFKINQGCICGVADEIFCELAN